MKPARVSTAAAALILVAMVGCHARRARKEAPAGTPSAATSLDASSESAPARADAGPRPSAPQDLALVECMDYGAAMAKGREATRSKRYADAVSAFHSAVRRRPFDAAAWAEQGYAELLAGGECHRSLAFAKTRTKKAPLLSAIWFNDAECYAREGKSDLARVHYAVAASYGNRTAVAKLGAQSRCTATWATPLDPLPVQKGWVEVLRAMPEATCAEQRQPKETEKEARKEACRGCEAIGYPLDGEDHCQGKGPWQIDNGHMHCHTFSVAITPLGGNRFVVLDGAEPALDAVPSGWRSVFHDTAEEFRPRQIWPQDFEENASCPEDDATPELEPDAPNSPSCGEAGEPTVSSFVPAVHRYYDRAGKGRLAVTVWSGSPEVTFAGNVATIRGAGCEEKVATSP